MPICLRDQDRDSGAAPQAGFTLIEVMIVLAIIATLVAFAIPQLLGHVNAAKAARAAQEIRVLEGDLTAYEAGNGMLPPDLASIGRGTMVDPWGRPYQYNNLTTAAAKGSARKDKFLVPLNSDYDLYSMGADGMTAAALTASASKDDVVRANDGAFVGLASKY